MAYSEEVKQALTELHHSGIESAALADLLENVAMSPGKPERNGSDAAFRRAAKELQRQAKRFRKLLNELTRYKRQQSRKARKAARRPALGNAAAESLATTAAK